ncbi:hypothetical protein EVAR_95429_1 [Eumeta japonica]|uniref:Mos1 transposase HTH domain-containing protein n=1 Tax=Eumeta variegata TaxID=151549 RepID=A0A4C1VJR0_EUMVA|nr:hypothetical protein EVAR_95429_1 [Eumeta japonica]
MKALINACDRCESYNGQTAVLPPHSKSPKTFKRVRVPVAYSTSIITQPPSNSRLPSPLVHSFLHQISYSYPRSLQRKAPPKLVVQNWFKRFQFGNFAVKDNSRSSRSSTDKVDAILEKY